MNSSESKVKDAAPRSSQRSARNAGNRYQLTPLWIISLFVSLSETVLGVAATKLTGNLQVVLVVFVVAFPILVATAFFFTLWTRPYVFYSPGEYGSTDVEKFIGALSQGRFTKVVKRASDLKDETRIFGNPDQFQLLFKVVGDGWKKSTKAMEVANGCLVQVTSEQLNSDGTLSLSEAVAFIQGVGVEKDELGEGKHLCPLSQKS